MRPSFVSASSPGRFRIVWFGRPSGAPFPAPGGDAITLEDKDSISVSALKQGFESWFPSYMAAEEIPVTN